MRSNLNVWQRLQEDGYFEKHPCYLGINDFVGEESVQAIERCVELGPHSEIVVIGCGYGRETRLLAPLVGRVYGIDVNKTILDKAETYLSERGIDNFVPVLAEDYERQISNNIHVVFSIVVMQHLTRDLVRDYFSKLGPKLVRGGAFVMQFLDERSVAEDKDAELSGDIEPSISWTPWQLVDLAHHASLELANIRTTVEGPTALWHWAHFRRPD